MSIDDVTAQGGLASFYVGRVLQDFVLTPGYEVAVAVRDDDKFGVVIAVVGGVVKPVRAADKAGNVAQVLRRSDNLERVPDATPGTFGPRSVGAAQNPAGIVSGNLKTLKKGRLRNAGVDAEAAKAADLGRDARKFNISVDDAGNVFYVPVKKGASDPIPAFRTLEDLAEEFPLGR